MLECPRPGRPNRRRSSDTPTPARRYQRRRIVERFFARLQWKRQLSMPWEYYAALPGLRASRVHHPAIQRY